MSWSTYTTTFTTQACGGPPSAVAKADAPGADLPAACHSCSDTAVPSPAKQASKTPLRMARVVESTPQSVSDALTAMGGDANTVENLVIAEVLKALGR